VTRHRYRIEVVGRTGSHTVAATLNPEASDPTDAVLIDSVSWALNGFGVLTFRVGVSHSNVTALSYGREVRVKMTDDGTVPGSGDIVWWGVILNRTIQGPWVQITAEGFLWYLSRLTIGKAQRENYLSNGALDGALSSMPSSWSLATAGSTANFTGQSANTVQPVLGNTALELYSSTRSVDRASDGEPIDEPEDPRNYSGSDHFARQTFTSPWDNIAVVAAWFWIRDDATFSYAAKPYDRRGLAVYVLNSAGTEWTGRAGVYPITDQTPRNQWIRAEVQVFAQTNEVVDVRLYCPGGTGATSAAIVWDAAQAVYYESLSYGYGTSGATDPTTVIEGIVSHVQSTAFDKESLGILAAPSNSSTASSAAVQIAYQFVEHHNAWESILDYVAPRSDAPVIVSGSWNSAGSDRYVRVEAEPTLASAVTMSLNLSDAITVAPFDSIAATATSVIATGTGSGPSREEAAAVTASTTLPILETVVAMPPDWPLNLFTARARGELAKRDEPTERVVIEIGRDGAPGSLLPNYTEGALAGLRPGRLVGLTGTRGTLVASATKYRVVGVALNPTTGVYTLSLTKVRS